MMKKMSFLFFWITSCSPNNKEHKPLITENSPAATNNQSIDYGRIKVVFAQYCSTCHPSRVAPNWMEYSEAFAYVENGKLKQRVVIEKSMPQQGSPEAASMTEEDRQLIAKWIQDGAPEVITETSPLISPLVSGPAEPEDVKTLSAVKSCLGCHGNLDSQNSLTAGIPKILGQNKKYLWHQLMNFKWYDRIDPTFQMNLQVASLSEDTILEIADYFSKLSRAPIFDSSLPLPVEEKVFYDRGQRLSSACVYCHKSQQQDITMGSGIIPILNGQSHLYLKSQLLYYQKGLRENNLMESVISGYTHEEIEAIAIYFSRTGYQTKSD